MREMEDEEVRDRGVEAGVRELERLGVALDESDRRVASGRDREHLRRAIDAGDARTASGRAFRDVPGAGRDVEQPCSRAGVDRIEQGVDRVARDRTEQALVRRRVVGRPAGALEGIEVRGHVGSVSRVARRTPDAYARGR
jgi:hypothetical protein